MPARPALLHALLGTAGLLVGAGPSAASPVDGFEHGLPAGVDAGGIVVGFYTFQDSGAAAIATTPTPPAPVPGAPEGNTVLRLDVQTDTYAGFAHVFGNANADALAPRDWSAYRGISFWLHGSGSGIDLYIDVLDNRADVGTYPFELWTATFKDDVSGWRRVSVSFADLTRKDIGNGAPDDGLGLTEVHGWALGTLATDGPATYHVDDVRLVASIPEPATLGLFGAGLLMTLRAARRQPR